MFNSPRGPGQFAKAKLVRYADDFVILAKHIRQDTVDWIEREIETHFKLKINRDKTKTVKLLEPDSELCFLGYSFHFVRDLYGRGTYYLTYGPSDKSIIHAEEQIYELTSSRNAFSPIEEIIGYVNRFLAGWGNYFHFGYPQQAFRKLDNYVLNRIVQYLRRLSQRPFKPPEGQTYYHEVYNVLQVIRLAGYFRRKLS